MIRSGPAASRATLWGLILLFGLWAIGQWQRDTSTFSALLFYFPSPLLALLALVISLGNLRRKRWSRALFALFLLLPPAHATLRLENQWQHKETLPPDDARQGENLHRQPAPTAERLRVVHWNVANNILGWSHTERSLRRHRADFYLLSEMSRWEDFAVAAESLSEGRQILRLGSMIALGKGRLESLGWLSQTNALKAHLLRWTPGEQPILILAVDMASNLGLPRGPSLQRIADMLANYHPHLVLGDFNTPRHSSYLDPPPDGYRHAYWLAGKGWSYTWPAIFPLLSIDQSLTSDAIALHRYRLTNTLLSDHRPQILDFSLRSP